MGNIDEYSRCILGMSFLYNIYIYIVFIHGRFFLPENGGFQFMAMFIGKLVKSHTFFGGINSSQ